MHKIQIKPISEVQQLREKESRNILHEYVGTKLRKRRCSRSSCGAGINFLINISSSGTNLNKKIQDEISKLEYVEKKIRNHKTNAKIICSSAKVPNKVPYDRKLKHMLANMLDNIHSVGVKAKKLPKSIQKMGEVETDNSTVRKREKIKKSLQGSIKVDSFTNVEDKQKSKIEKKRDKMKKSISFRKSSLKKPAFEPCLKCNALGTDLKFAESLNFGQKVDFHLSLSEMEKIVVPPKKDVLKLVADKSSGSYVNCTYDSTSYNEVNFDFGASKNKMNKRCSGTVFVQESKSMLKELEDGSIVEDKVKTREKPERKRFYSYLRRGNFTISHHTDESTEHHLEKNSNINVQYIKEKKQEDEKTKETVILNNHLENGTGVVGDDQTSVIPIDLIERSILAVENILRTINSITKDFSERKAIKNAISKTPPEHLLKITESSFKQDRQQVVGRKKLIESYFEKLSKDSQKEVVILKSPIKSFYASEEEMFSHYGKGQFEKEVANNNNLEENMDPLKKAINSLKNENISKRPTICQASKLNVEQSCSFSSSFSCVNFTASRKLYNSSILKQILLDNNFSSNTNVTGNKFSCYSSDISKCSNLFPECNFQKCLSLLRKKFGDFDKIRQKGFIDNSGLATSLQPKEKNAKKFEKNETVDEMNSMVYGQTNRKENYEVCFKNENFKNQSETSIESCYRMNIENLNINPIQGMMKSSPVINK